MKFSTQDPGVQVILESQLRSANVSWIHINPAQDFPLGEHQFAVYFACISKGDMPIDAWVIMGGGSSGYYNLDNYPTVQDAICQHIGRLVLDGKFCAYESNRD